jgi:hypothetical protein
MESCRCNFKRCLGKRKRAAADLSSASIVFIDTEFSFWGSPASYLGTLLDISAGANHLKASVLDP